MADAGVNGLEMPTNGDSFREAEITDTEAPGHFLPPTMVLEEATTAPKEVTTAPEEVLPSTVTEVASVEEVITITEEVTVAGEATVTEEVTQSLLRLTETLSLSQIGRAHV